MEMKRYEYDTKIQEVKDKGGAYVAFPYDVLRRQPQRKQGGSFRGG